MPSTLLRHAAAALAAALLAGCASTAPGALPATPVPADRQPAFRDPVADGATLILVREASGSDSDCLLTVTIGTQVAARLLEGEAATLYLPAGSRQIALGRGGSESCSKDRRFGSVLTGRFAAGEVQRLSLQITRSTIDAQPLATTPEPATGARATPEPAAAALPALPAASTPASMPVVPAAPAVPAESTTSATPPPASPAAATAALPAAPTAPTAPTAPIPPVPPVPVVPGYLCAPLAAPQTGFSCVPAPH